MSTNERLIDAALPIVRLNKKAQDFDRDRRIDQAIDAQGRVILDDRDFYPIRSTPSGKLMRLRVADDGTVYATEVI